MSQDIVVTSAQPNFDQLKDPDEFFAAYERQENAEKELRRLMGENLVDQSSSHCLLESRMRRQGILGKTATYRHSYTAISVDASKHLSTVEKSETGNNSIPSPRNDYGLPSSASMSVHGTGMNQGMAKDNVLNENGKGTEIGAPLDRHHDELFGSLLDSYCNLDEGQTFNLLQKSLKLQEIDMHKIQFPKFNRFSLHEIMSPQASTSREESRLESKIFNFADQTLNSKVSEETPKTDHAVWGTTHSPATSPTPPKSPFAAISSFCRHKSQKMSEKDTSHSSLMFNLMKESSFATHFELEAPSHPGDILQQGRLAILHGPASESVDKNGSLLDGFPHSKELEKNTTRTGLNSVTTQADGLAGPEWHGQEKNLTVDSSYEIESSSISQLPGQEACDIDKNSSAFETVSVDCLSDQVSDKNSNMENSIMKISNSCCPIQRLTSEECKTVSSDFGRNGARDDVTCPGVELGKNSNGSDNDVNPPTGMSNDCMNDKNLDMENSIMKISNSCCPIQRLTSEECKTVSSDFGRNVARDDVTCPGVELGKNSNGSDSDVNPPTGMSNDCMNDKNLDMENSIMKISNSCCPIQRLTSAECKTVSSDFGRNVARDDVTCPGVEQGKNSNGSDNDVNPPTGMSNDCMNDKNLDIDNSIKIQSTPGIQHLALKECDAVNMLNNGLTCSAGEDLGKNPKGSANCVDPQTGALGVCIENSVQATANPSSTAQEVVDSNKGQGSPTGVCKPQEQHVNETSVSSDPQNETSEAASKALGRKRSKRLDSDRRKSLLGAGSAWQCGVRRSTRIKSRPLEYWKGERFLYGRVHNSLVTVIGVKYSSPVDNSKNRTLKVKSFVSDEYSHMLDLAGSH